MPQARLSVPHPVVTPPETLFRHFIREYSACGVSLRAAAYWVAILGITLFSFIMVVTSYYYVFGERHAHLNTIIISKEKTTTSSVSEGLVIFGIVTSAILALLHLSLLAGIHKVNFEAITGCWNTMVIFFTAYFGFMVFVHIIQGKNLCIPREEVIITLSSFYAIWLVGCYRVEMMVKMEAEKSNNADILDTVKTIKN